MQFGPYTLVRRLAFGGMAEVFLAEKRGPSGFAKQVALKRILPHLASDKNFVAMFTDEAKLASQLNHPNIAQIFDFGHVKNVYYIAMEYVDGVDLQRLLAPNSRLTVAETAWLGEQVAQALAYAHQARSVRGQPLHLVHRDVSPQNIMITRQGAVKLMDFGIARAAQRLAHTQTGVVRGKVAYMAPEQARGEPVDARGDQFALGVVLWECFNGRRLFSGASDLQILQAVLACEIPRTEHAPLNAVLQRALAKDPSARFADLNSLAESLASLRDSHAVHLDKRLAVTHEPVALRTQSLTRRGTQRLQSRAQKRMSRQTAAGIVLLTVLAAALVSLLPQTPKAHALLAGTGPHVPPAPRVEAPAILAKPPRHSVSRDSYEKQLLKKLQREKAEDIW